jgi:hypothetical protein
LNKNEEIAVKVENEKQKLQIRYQSWIIKILSLLAIGKSAPELYDIITKVIAP